MVKTSILILEYHNYGLVANTLYCLAKDNRYEIHFLSRNSKSAFRFSPFVKSHHYFPKEEPIEAFLAFAQLVTERTKARVLVPTDSSGFQFIVQNKEKLQAFIDTIPVPEPWAFQTANNKDQLASFMQQHNISAPPTIFSISEDLDTQLDAFSFPVLLKPTVGSRGQGAAGKPGITYFSNKPELLAFITKHQIKDNYVIQGFVDGYEIDFNALYQDGKLVAYTIQQGLTKEKEFEPCFGIEFINNDEVVKVAGSLLSALKWNGVAHIDLICDKATNQLYILEINPRFWLTIGGSMVAANINFPALTCMMTLHEPVDKVHYKLGKYIPLSSFIKHRFGSRTAEKVRFRWHEIDMSSIMVHILPDFYRLYHRLVNRLSAKKALDY